MHQSLSGTLNFRITRFNHAFERLTGRTEQDIVGQDLSILFPGDTRNASMDQIKKTVAGERWEVVEIPILNVSGEIRIVLWNSANITGPDGKTIATIAQGNDISDRKRAEETLHETNEYLRNLLDYANAPIIVWDPDFRITRFNHAFERLTGRTEQDIVGQDLSILFPGDTRNASVDQIKKTVAGERWEVVEIPILNVSGEIRIVLWNSANITGPDGKTIATIAQGNDITERKRAEEALRETNEYLRNLQDYANAPIIVWDPDFRITRFNHAFERLTGRTEPGVIGRDLSILFPEDTRDASMDQIKKTLAGERWEVVEIPIRNVSGEIRIVLWNSANIVDPGGILISTIAQGQDISDRKKMELQREILIRELEQKNAELERFAYTASHDLKTPLITIRGFLGFVEQDAKSGDMERLQQDLDRIGNAAGKMQELLDSLLELSKIGRIAGPPEPVSMKTISQEAAELLAIPINEHNVTLTIAENLPEVYGDKKRLREVMVNLIENSAKFMGDQERPRIEIGVRFDSKTPVFFVRDNGIGIPPEYQGRLFLLFERIEVNVPGTGVGLALVKRIIEFHGGKIWVESEGKGKGTTFWFTIPGEYKENNNVGGE